MRPIAVLIAVMSLLGMGLILSPDVVAAEAVPSKLLPTEQENAAEKFFSALEASLAEKFFDARQRPVIRVAVFDFTDTKGNGVGAGRELAEKITKRLHRQSQFEVVSQGQLQRYLSLNGLNTLGRLDAPAFASFRRRVNTLDPNHGIHALVTGEVQKGVSRNLRVTASILNFEAPLGAFELEKNLLDVRQVQAEIPYPTEKALQEASEVILPVLSHQLKEGRLVVLANTRGNNLLETAQTQAFGVGKPFPWEKAPYVLLLGKEEVTMPGQIKVGLDDLVLAPLEFRRESAARLEYSFLHGKFGTNEIYFDEAVPAQAYGLVTSFVDLRTNETYSDLAKIQVHPGATTVAVLSFYMPSEKERIRNKQVPGIQIYQLFGKGLEFLPKR
jgi:TolB-like protein